MKVFGNEKNFIGNRLKMKTDTGILYHNGEYYLVHYPAIPDAELSPVPGAPSEEGLS